jgi:ABC-type bacteriocin/lantibiotic exporter with double-glycine peptidase domain
MITKPENIGVTKNFIRVPLCRQETEYTCGVACVQSILKCYGMDYNQEVLAETLQSKPILGTDFKDIINFMRQLGFKAYFVENMSIDGLKFLISNGITPMLMIQAWAGNGVDYVSDWKDAHYVIACGYDKNRIFFMDPYTLGNYTYIPVSELLKRWHVIDKCIHKYYRSGLIIKKEHCSFEYDPSAMKYLG